MADPPLLLFVCVFHSPPALVLFYAELGDVCSTRTGWMLALEASVTYSLHNICCYCSSFPACHEIWFLPKVAFVCTIVNSIIVFFGQFPRCRGSYCLAYRPVATQQLSEVSILSLTANLFFNIMHNIDIFDSRCKTISNEQHRDAE